MGSHELLAVSAAEKDHQLVGDPLCAHRGIHRLRLLDGHEIVLGRHEESRRIGGVEIRDGGCRGTVRTLPRVVLYNANPRDNALFASIAGAFSRPGRGVARAVGAAVVVQRP